MPHILNWKLLPLCILLGCLQGRAHGQEQEDLLAGELQALTFEYALGSRLHRAYVADAKVLSKMSAALHVVSREPVAPKPSRSKILGHLPTMILDMGAGRRHSFHIAGRNQLHHADWGRMTLGSDFFREVEAWISTIEETKVRLNVENPFPKARLQRLLAFQELDDNPWREALIRGPGHSVQVHGTFALQEFKSAYQELYVPAQSNAGEQWGYSIEMSSWLGTATKFALVDSTKCATRPLHATLLRHGTLGVVWVDDSFRDALLESHSQRFPVEDDRQAMVMQDARKAVGFLLRVSHQTLLSRGVLPAERKLQHIWSVPTRDLRSHLSDAQQSPEIHQQQLGISQRKEAWLLRPIKLGSVTWLDESGRSWTLFQSASSPSWLPPLAEWVDSEPLWAALQESVR